MQLAAPTAIPGLPYFVQINSAAVDHDLMHTGTKLFVNWYCMLTFDLLCTQGNGVIVGLGICGVVINATSSAAGLMGDFRTGYICLAAPRAMFGAQLVGQLLGAVLTPLAFMLFYETGQVRGLMVWVLLHELHLKQCSAQ